MKKMYIILAVIALITLIIPIPKTLDNNGSVEFKALIYKVTKLRKYNENAISSYNNELTVEIFGMKVYEKITDNSKYEYKPIKV